MSDKLAIIGSRDSILGFKALGLDCYPVDNPSDALEVVKDLIFTKQEYHISY
jgi:vacuolar-type H+-ATPase subunit F/Vma7